MKTLLILSLVLIPSISYATPGAVNKAGCHSKPKHCHSSAEITKRKNGTRYVQFGRG